MKYFKSPYYLLLLVGVIVLGTITGCDKDDDDTTVPGETVDQLVAKDADLSLFKTAIARANLGTFTTGPGPFTFLAPTNAAFNAIGINNDADVNAIDVNALVNILTYHIIPGRRLIVEIPVGPNAPITTEGGLSIYASKSGGNAYLNGVKITSADIAGSNGVIQKLDRVIFPPLYNALTVLGGNTNHKLFVQAINKAAVTTSFTGTPALITVFAPTNAAMIAAGYDSTTIANTAAVTLSPIVRYHVVNTRLYSSGFKTDSLKSIQGAKFHLQAGSPSKVKGNTNTGYIDIIGTDISSSNGPIHIISGVLKP